MAVNVAAQVRKSVKVPVFAEGRIHRPEYATSIINDDLVDGVYMNRALICDPELPAKLSAEREKRIRPCLACNQGCQVRRNMGKPLMCILNPVAGVEARERIQATAEVKKKVLIVGGGPSGMEAARVAASRGHKVTLWEAGMELGGNAKLGLPEFARALAFWQNELVDRGVTVVTHKQASTDEILAETNLLHNHDSHHSSSHEHSVHRNLGDIVTLIENSDMAPQIKVKSVAVFQKLAYAEAKIHGTVPEKIHFHEVGAVDAIVDIVGAVTALHLLNIDKILVSPLPLGQGFVRCQHGVIPVPAPATLELLIGMKTFGSEHKGETVTPTGQLYYRP